MMLGLSPSQKKRKYFFGTARWQKKIKISAIFFIDLMHGLATEEGRRTSFLTLRYGCQLQAENQNKHG
jgi:hypothetical protein